MTNSFNPGEVVILKSGGPQMTIESIKGDEAELVWFADGKPGEVCSRFLKLVTLQRV